MSKLPKFVPRVYALVGSVLRKRGIRKITRVDKNVRRRSSIIRRYHIVQYSTRGSYLLRTPRRQACDRLLSADENVFTFLFFIVPILCVTQPSASCSSKITRQCDWLFLQFLSGTRHPNSTGGSYCANEVRLASVTRYKRMATVFVHRFDRIFELLRSKSLN